MIDVHCHLEHMENPSDVVNEAKERGMRAIFTSVADPKNLADMLILQRKHRGFLFLCAGFHPEHVKDYSDAGIGKYITMIRNAAPDIAAIGEVGLEYRGDYDAIQQQEVFKRFIDLAMELKKPLVIHCRDAWNDVPKILAEKKVQRVIFHCYSGTESLSEFILTHPAWYLSFATNACYTKKHPRLMHGVPLSRMLLETDAPWLDPERPPGVEQKLTNRPWKIVHTAEVVANIKNIDKEEALSQTAENALHVFGIM
ncbi:MAG: TatD family hydrolase [Candidatus Aenigmarchaeota archaeon]|nr:TatD family hydrolase [Candidatus Aenigmarchaeota archaeon]